MSERIAMGGVIRELEDEQFDLLRVINRIRLTVKRAKADHPEWGTQLSDRLNDETLPGLRMWVESSNPASLESILQNLNDQFEKMEWRQDVGNVHHDR